jgi:hypothetical protein
MLGAFLITFYLWNFVVHPHPPWSAFSIALRSSVAGSAAGLHSLNSWDGPSPQLTIRFQLWQANLQQNLRNYTTVYQFVNLINTFIEQSRNIDCLMLKNTGKIYFNNWNTLLWNYALQPFTSPLVRSNGDKHCPYLQSHQLELPRKHLVTNFTLKVNSHCCTLHFEGRFKI